MSLSLATVTQMHADLGTITSHVALERIPENTLRLFNFHLEAAKEMYPENPVLQKVHQATGQTAYHDLLLSAGQLRAVLAEEEARR